MKFTPFWVLGLFLLSACVPKSELDEANQKIAELQALNSQLKVEIEKKPELPVTVLFRQAMMGPGNVAVFSTTIKSPVSILVTLHSSALGTTKRFELHLESSHATELGHLEGAVIENGDTITIENQNYSPTTFTVSL